MGEREGAGARRRRRWNSRHGSGTHGYLPPECYEGDASRIDTKVDVFSAGVVFYVMLFYPHKPFFRQANQAEIMQMQPHAIRTETQALAFPAKVSADAQALLRRCLNPNRDERPDVLASSTTRTSRPPARRGRRVRVPRRRSGGGFRASSLLQIRFGKRKLSSCART